MLTQNDNGSWYCDRCRCIVILFDDDTHDDCADDDGAERDAAWERMLAR